MLHLGLVVFGTPHGLNSIKVSLLTIYPSCIVYVHHLVLQKVLHVLVLLVLGQSVPICFDAKLACIFINHITPELILLFL